MTLVEVLSAQDKKDFLAVSARINRQFPNYVQPLNGDINEVFDPKTNTHFDGGDACRWILKGEDGLTIGRVAAFVYEKYLNFGTDFATGCLGFFDCIDNQEAANMLFDTAKDWLIKKGMVAMDGPINFGDRDKWWGLMVNGFEKEPIYGMAFNPPYYERLFEAYGFQNYYNQYYFSMNIDDDLPEKYVARYEKFKKKSAYQAKHVEPDKLDKYAKDFATVYNAAWSQHNEGKEITVDAITAMFRKMKPIIDARIIWFAYYKDEPIAMWINIPDLNQYFKHFNGKLGLWQKLQLLWMKKTGACKRFTGIAFGVVPKYQALGVDSFMITEGAKFIQTHRLYSSYEMGWTGDWNPRMLNIYKGLGGKQSRHLITYRYIFDKNIPFERHPIMDYGSK